MTADSTTILGIEIPSTDPVFLAVIVGIHIPLGIACVMFGAVAMLSEKRRGRHSTFGTVYYWSLCALFASATFLFDHAMGRELSSVHFGSALIGVGVVWSCGPSTAMAQLGSPAHHRDGALVCSDAHRLLRGQRKTATALERPASCHVLAVASCHWNPAHRSCPLAASRRTGTNSLLVKRAQPSSKR